MVSQPQKQVDTRVEIKWRISRLSAKEAVNKKKPATIAIAAGCISSLDSADTLDALKALPSNAFEALLGDRAGQYSIRINMQWRICFIWNEGAENVEIVDYH